MSEQLRASIKRWDILTEGVISQVNEAQKALVEARKKVEAVRSEKERIARLKAEYSDKLSTLQQAEHDINSTTQVRRFLNQLDMASQTLGHELVALHQQQQCIRQKFQALSAQRLKFEALGKRAQDEMTKVSDRAEQRSTDMLALQRFGQRKLG